MLAQLLAAHLGSKDFSAASSAAWRDILAEMLEAGVGWSTQLMAQLAAVHGLVEDSVADGNKYHHPYSCALFYFADVVLEQPGQRDRVAAVQAAAEGLAAMVMAITKLPNAHALAIRCCGYLIEQVMKSAEQQELSAAEQAELLEAAKPAVMGMLQAAAAVVHSHGPSKELYSALRGSLSSLPSSAWHAWCLELLDALHPAVLPPAWLHGKSKAELRGFDSQWNAEWILEDGIELVELTSLWRAKSGKLRAVLLRYVLENPWLPGTAILLLHAVVKHWPGCLDQPAGALGCVVACWLALHAKLGMGVCVAAVVHLQQSPP